MSARRRAIALLAVTSCLAVLTHTGSAADSTFEQLGSVGHRAAAWIAKADLDTSRGSAEAAAAHYRRAAEALQDFHF